MDALALVMGRRFEERLAIHAQAAFPAEAKSLDASAADRGGLMGFIRACIERAELLDIDSDADIAVFVALLMTNLRLGPSKDAVLGWSREMLESEDVPGPLKLEWILTRLADFAADDPDSAAALQWLRHAEERFQA